jgi:hypothetical protein
MNRRQLIVVLCAAILLHVLKMLRPPFRPWEEGNGAGTGVFTNGNVMAMIAAVAAVAVILLVIFSRRK